MMKSFQILLIVCLFSAAFARPAQADQGDVYLRNNCSSAVHVWVNGVYQGYVPPDSWRFASECGFDPTGKLPDGHRSKRVKGGWNVDRHAAVVSLSLVRSGANGTRVAFPSPAPTGAFWSPSSIPVVWFGTGSAGVRPSKEDLRAVAISPIEYDEQKAPPVMLNCQSLVAQSAAIDPIVGTTWKVRRVQIRNGPADKHFLHPIDEIITFKTATSFLIYRVKEPSKVFAQFSWDYNNGGLSYAFDRQYAVFKSKFVSGTEFDGSGTAGDVERGWYQFRIHGVLRPEISQLKQPVNYKRRYLAPDSWMGPTNDAL